MTEEEILHDKIRKMADAKLGKDGELEFDSDAKVSEGEDNGAYVQAWAWISFVGTDLDKEGDTLE